MSALSWVVYHLVVWIPRPVYLVHRYLYRLYYTFVSKSLTGMHMHQHTPDTFDIYGKWISLSIISEVCIRTMKSTNEVEVWNEQSVFQDTAKYTKIRSRQTSLLDNTWLPNAFKRFKYETCAIHLFKNSHFPNSKIPNSQISIHMRTTWYWLSNVKRNSYILWNI